MERKQPSPKSRRWPSSPEPAAPRTDTDQLEMFPLETLRRPLPPSLMFKPKPSKEKPHE